MVGFVSILGVVDIIAAILIAIGDFPYLGFAKYILVAILLIKGIPSLLSR